MMTKKKIFNRPKKAAEMEKIVKEGDETIEI